MHVEWSARRNKNKNVTGNRIANTLDLRRHGSLVGVAAEPAPSAVVQTRVKTVVVSVHVIQRRHHLPISRAHRQEGDSADCQHQQAIQDHIKKENRDLPGSGETRVVLQDGLEL